jgi:hypothetical protein
LFIYGEKGADDAGGHVKHLSLVSNEPIDNLLALPEKTNPTQINPMWISNQPLRKLGWLSSRLVLCPPFDSPDILSRCIAIRLRLWQRRIMPTPRAQRIKGSNGLQSRDVYIERKVAIANLERRVEVGKVAPGVELLNDFKSSGAIYCHR